MDTERITIRRSGVPFIGDRVNLPDMASEGGSKVGKVVIVAILAVAGFFGYRFVTWNIIYEMHVSEMMTDFPRYPNPEDIINLKGRVIAEAPKAHVSSEGLEVTVYLQQKEMGGGVSVLGQNADRWWYVNIDAKKGSMNNHWEKRIENTIADTAKEALEKGGVAYRAPVTGPVRK
jgi:hypothetical protein